MGGAGQDTDDLRAPGQGPISSSLCTHQRVKSPTSYYDKVPKAKFWALAR